MPIPHSTFYATFFVQFLKWFSPRCDRNTLTEKVFVLTSVMLYHVILYRCRSTATRWRHLKTQWSLENVFGENSLTENSQFHWTYWKWTGLFFKNRTLHIFKSTRIQHLGLHVVVCSWNDTSEPLVIMKTQESSLHCIEYYTKKNETKTWWSFMAAAYREGSWHKTCLTVLTIITLIKHNSHHPIPSLVH